MKTVADIVNVKLLEKIASGFWIMVFNLPGAAPRSGSHCEVCCAVCVALLAEWCTKRDPKNVKCISV